MNRKSNYINPLKRDGISRAARVLHILDPGNVKIDDRSTAALITEAANLAKQVRYWDLDNDPSSQQNWEFMFANDTALAAALSVSNTRTDEDKFNRQLDVLHGSGSAATLDADNFKPMLAHLFDMITELEDWYNKAQHAELRQELLRIIRAQAAPALRQLAEYDSAAVRAFVTPTGTIPSGTTFSGRSYSGLDAAWGTVTYMYNAAAVTRLYGSGGSEHLQLSFAVNAVKVLFTAVIDIRNLVFQKAAEIFGQRLQTFSDHEPHFALFIAFLQMFRHAQDQVNTLPKAHLDYYYRDVLMLSEKPEVPDKVHLIFELAKNVTEHLLPAGTQFKAGKDKDGKDIIFQTDHEIVLNKAKIDSVKSILLDKDANGKVKTVYAAPVANSADGKGAALNPADPRWKMFGEKKTDAPHPMIEAEIGFAISSPILYLGEGTREVTFTINLANTLSDPVTVATDLRTNLDLYFSTAKGWIQPDNISSTYTAFRPVVTATSTSLVVKVELSSAWPSIVAPARGGQLQAKWPVVKFIARPGSNAYEHLRNIKVRNYTIAVNVKGVKDLILQNDQGRLNTTKPFYPFTSQPNRGANLYIGSQEVFSKKLTELRLHIEWFNLPTNDFSKHYQDYRDGSSSLVNSKTGNFAGRLSILDNYEWKTLMKESPATSANTYPKFEDTSTAVLITGGYVAAGYQTQAASQTETNQEQ